MRLAIVAPLIVLLVLAVRRYRRRTSPRQRLAPKHTAKPTWTARLTETLLLAIVGVTVLVRSGMNDRMGGLLGILPLLAPDYARLNVLMFAGAAIGVAISLLIALLGRTALATLAMVVVLGGYGFLINGGDYPGECFASTAKPETMYTLTVGRSDVHGADLWVNDVYVGKTPVTMPIAEFQEKVPYWDKVPTSYEADIVKTPDYTPGGQSNREYRQWSEIWFPDRAAFPRRRGERPGPDGFEKRTYYARIRYGDEWGVTSQGSGIYSAGGGKWTYSFESTVPATFRQRDRRLDSLLDLARLADYKVGPEWFEAAATYNEDGWKAVRNAAMTEPGMNEVFDTWATTRYDLGTVTDADSAWAALERICRDVDARGGYDSTDLAGRAVERVAPHLNVERLCDRADQLLRTDGPHGTTSCRFAVMHAIRMIHERQQAAGAETPTLIQRRLGPELIRQGRVELAASIGGPQVESYLLRQNWRRMDVKWPDDDAEYILGGSVNKWMLLLASRDTKAGRRFRIVNQQVLLQLAERIYTGGIGSGSWRPEMDYLFLDPWLAPRFWPRFAELIRRKSPSWNALSYQYDYLAKLGDAATVEMFLDAWRKTHEITIHPALGKLDSLDEAKRKAIVDALIEEIRRNPSNLSRASDPWTIDRAISRLQNYKSGRTRMTPEYILSQLSPGGDLKRENVTLWLEHTKPDSPLVGVLASRDDPALRLLVFGACRRHPTPEHRAILDRLAKDPDEKVRETAAATIHALAAEARRDPMDFADTAAARPTEAPLSSR